jgi:hypothetical protein
MDPWIISLPFGKIRNLTVESLLEKKVLKRPAPRKLCRFEKSTAIYRLIFGVFEQVENITGAKKGVRKKVENKLVAEVVREGYRYHQKMFSEWHGMCVNTVPIEWLEPRIVTIGCLSDKR